MDFLREIFKFFIAKEYSFTSKFISVVVVVFIVFFIDNLLGFSFYYANNQKINQLKTIESLQKDSQDNAKLLKMLSETKEDIINRKNIIEGFLDLFSKDALDEEQEISQKITDTIIVIRYDTIMISQSQPYYKPWGFYPLDSSYYEARSPNRFDRVETPIFDSSLIREKDSIILEPEEHATMKKSRSKIWHTLSSSYGFILLLIILPIIPFTEDTFDLSMMIGVIFIMIVDAGIIWFNQYLLGLIPLIYNSPWINYSLNFLIQTVITVWMFFYFHKRGQKNL